MSKTVPMTLPEFLRARYAEDEERAYLDLSETPRARVLADVEAKRRIVELHAWESDLDDGVTPPVEFNTDCFECRQAPPCPTLRLLALPYADHPDYREEEWRP